MKLTERVGLREFRLTLAVCIPSFIGIAICSQFKGDPLTEVIENVLVISLGDHLAAVPVARVRSLDTEQDREGLPEDRGDGDPRKGGITAL